MIENYDDKFKVTRPENNKNEIDFIVIKKIFKNFAIIFSFGLIFLFSGVIALLLHFLLSILFFITGTFLIVVSFFQYSKYLKIKLKLYRQKKSTMK